MNIAPSVSFEIEATCVNPSVSHPDVTKVLAAAVPAAKMTSVV
jgi:hypothetical protein